LNDLLYITQFSSKVPVSPFLQNRGNMQQRRNNWQGKTMYLEKNLTQCHSVHPNSHMESQ